MARLPNTATKEERREVHKAKVAGKKFDRDRRHKAFELARNQFDREMARRTAANMRLLTPAEKKAHGFEPSDLS